MDQIELRSDNAAGVAPEIMAAITASNAGSALAYGDDAVTAHLQSVVRDVFEHPSARVFPVTSGTAANALALTSLCPPWGAVLCHESSHILNSEGGATSMLGGGAVTQGVDGDGHRIHPDGLGAALDAVRWGDPHHSDELVYCTKRSGHVTSKMRFQSEQLIAYLTDDLWLRLAGHSNRQMERLAAGPGDAGVKFLDPTDANIAFARVLDEVAKQLETTGLLFYRIGPGLIRLVTSWQTSDADIDQTLERFATVLGRPV